MTKFSIKMVVITAISLVETKLQVGKVELIPSLEEPVGANPCCKLLSKTEENFWTMKKPLQIGITKQKENKKVSNLKADF